MSNGWNSLNSDDKEQVHEFVKHIKANKGAKMSKKEALAWQAGQLELVNQLLELLPTHNIKDLLKGWKQILIDSEPV